jgi:predicted aminopeptidase
MVNHWEAKQGDLKVGFSLERIKRISRLYPKFLTLRGPWEATTFWHASVPKGLLLFFLASALPGCYFGYIVKQGYYQSQLLTGKKTISQVLKRNDLDPKKRQKLELILAVRKFALERLALTPGYNYTTINPRWNHVVYNVMGSKPLAFEPYVWSFPIVGTVPYLGFFDPSDARAEAKRLKDTGYEVLIREVDAYSTVGFFRDPVWPKMLERSDRSLIDLIIHETSHATLYFPSSTTFNESFANFVAKAGTLTYLKERYGEHSPELRDAKAYYKDDERYQGFMWKLYQALDSIYQKTIPDAQKLKFKENTIDREIKALGHLQFKSAEFQGFKPHHLNNAELILFGTYNQDLGTFQRLLDCMHGDYSRFISALRTLKGSNDLVEALKHLVQKREREGCLVSQP